jgi:hypothetical protein
MIRKKRAGHQWVKPGHDGVEESGPASFGIRFRKDFFFWKKKKQKDFY